MKNYIFNKKFEEIFTKYRLSFELSQIKPKPEDFDAVSKDIQKGNFFGSEPKKLFSIPKSDSSYRKISVSSTKTKITQRVLAMELANVMRFNDKSYAFRKGKSPFKAIMRVRDMLRKYEHIAKIDIESFFDAIDHTILINKLKKIIADKSIIELIAYYISQGAIERNRWIDKGEGVYQGDVLSPILSNIYLNDFDYYLEDKGIPFVRYSDDILLFAKSKNEVSLHRKTAREYLHRIKLNYNHKKTYLSNIDKGFEYLGISFMGNSTKIDNLRLSKKIKKIHTETKNLNISSTVEKLNQKIVGFKAYYFKIVDDTSQIEELQNALDEVVVKKIIEEKEAKRVNSKKDIIQKLIVLKSYKELEHKKWIDSLISKAYKEMTLTI